MRWQDESGEKHGTGNGTKGTKRSVGTIGCKIIDAISPPLGTAGREAETAGRKTSR